jgi:hypothetical protein
MSGPPRYGPGRATEGLALTAHRSASPDQHHRLLRRPGLPWGVRQKAWIMHSTENAASDSPRL